MILDNEGPADSDFFSPDDVPASENADTGADTDTGDDAGEVEGDEDDNLEPELDENGDPVAKAEDDDQSADDEFEEIEHAGKKHKISKDLKPLLMMQQDYTRKTQEVAEERKTLETQRAQAQAEIAQQAEAVQLYTREIAQLHTIDERLQEYASVDWKAWEDQDPMGAQSGFREYQLLERQRGQLTQTLEQKQIQARQEQEKRSREAQQAEEQMLAKGHEETLRVVKERVAGWTEATGNKVIKFALDQGYKPDELKRIVADSRAMLMMHGAWEAEQLKSSQKAAAKKAQANIQPQGKPLTPVGKGRAAPATAGLDDRLSPDEWARRRNEQTRPKGR